MRRQIGQNPYLRVVRSLLKWIQSLLRWIFPSENKVNKLSTTPIVKSSQIEIVKPLTDTDYEFLFLQLLEGVGHGWNSARVEKFLSDLKNRTTKDKLVNWLHNFGERLLENPVDNQMLAKQMIQLGEIGCGELGKIAQLIGEKLLISHRETQVTKNNLLQILPIDSYSNQPNIGNENQIVKIKSIFGNKKILDLLKDDSLVEAMSNLLAIDSINIQAEIWLDRANKQYHNQDILAAINSYDQVLLINPNNHDVWYNRAVALKDLGRYEEAIASYDQALNIQPNCPDTWNNRGAILRNLERYQEAVISYDKALEIKSNKYETWYNRGIALFKLGRIEEAILSYDRALQLEPESHEAWNNKGNALKEINKYKAAIDCYDQALLIKPNKVEAWNNRGTALFSLERFEEAIANYEKALEIKPDLPEVWHNRGNALQKLGREAEAILSYDRALETANRF